MNSFWRRSRRLKFTFVRELDRGKTFVQNSSESCQIQPQLVQPLTVNASKRTQETVTKRRSVMPLNVTGEPVDF